MRFPEGFPLEGIRYYGLAYILAFAAALLFFQIARRRHHSPLPSFEVELDLFTYLIVGVVAGGRLGYVLLYDLNSFLSNPLIVFRIWDGGMASHGGMLGVAMAIWLFAMRHKIPLLALADLIVAIAPLGLLLGRVANFINGELWGRVSQVPWAVIFPAAPRDPVSLEILPRHPSQLYQATGEGLFLLIWLQWRFWTAKNLTSGRLAGEFLLIYGVVRVLLEFFREPDASLILGLSRGQFYSLFLIAAGAYLRFRRAHGENNSTQRHSSGRKTPD